MKIGIVADHRGFSKKQKTIKYLTKKGYTVIDYSPKFIDLDDYPDHGILLGEKLMAGEVDFGIAFCSNGVGICIAANKVKGIRCGKLDSTKEALNARKDDNINVAAISAEKPMFEIKDIIDVFLKAKFSTVERYSRRIAKLDAYEGRTIDHEQ